MPRMIFAGVACVFILSESVCAKSVETLRSEIQAICPSGKKARLTWSRGSDWQSNDCSAYVFDSESGDIREITPASLFGGSRKVGAPFLTRDGQRVAFTEEMSGNLYVIDWDGSNLKLLLDYAEIGGTWQEPDGSKQYVMAEFNGTSLINIADLSDTRQVWHSGYNDVWDTDGLGLSVDGLRFGAWLCDEGSGIAVVPDGNPVCNSHGGCNFTMRPTTGTYQYAHFPDGHESICIHNGNGSMAEEADVASTVPISGGEPAYLRFANDPDYVVYYWSGSNNLNPILFQISTKEYVAVYDDLGGDYAGHLDVVFFTPGTSDISSPALHRPVQAHAHAQPAEMYTLAGRRISGSPAMAGIHVRSEAGKVIVRASNVPGHAKR